MLLEIRDYIHYRPHTFTPPPTCNYVSTKNKTLLSSNEAIQW